MRTQSADTPPEIEETLLEKHRRMAPWEKLLTEPEENEDEGLIEKAVLIVRQSQRASASLLQRRLRIGYPRAARLLDQLEEMGVVGPSQGGGKERDVLLGPPDEEEAGSIP